jgi:hypothetical protein
MSEPLATALDHLVLTVADVEVTPRFYFRVPGRRSCFRQQFRQASGRHENAQKARDLPGRRTSRAIARPVLSLPGTSIQLEAISDVQVAIERSLRNAAVRIPERDRCFQTRRARSVLRNELRVQ